MNPSLFIHESSFSLFNHHHQTKYHHKQNCNRATLRSFSVKKIVVRMKNIKFRGIPQQKDEIPRLNSAAKFRGHTFRGSARNSAGRGKLWALVIMRPQSFTSVRVKPGTPVAVITLPVPDLTREAPNRPVPDPRGRGGGGETPGDGDTRRPLT